MTSLKDAAGGLIEIICVLRCAPRFRRCEPWLSRLLSIRIKARVKASRIKARRVKVQSQSQKPDKMHCPPTGAFQPEAKA